MVRDRSRSFSSREARILDDVAHDRPVALPAESAHAVLHVGEEALARLLAVVADVDAGRELAVDHAPSRLLDRAAKRRGVDRLAARQPREHLDQRLRPRQASRVGGEDSRLAREHPQTMARTASRCNEPREGRMVSCDGTDVTRGRALPLKA